MAQVELESTATAIRAEAELLMAHLAKESDEREQVAVIQTETACLTELSSTLAQMLVQRMRCVLLHCGMQAAARGLQQWRLCSTLDHQLKVADEERTAQSTAAESQMVHIADLQKQLHESEVEFRTCCILVSLLHFVCRRSVTKWRISLQRVYCKSGL